MALAEQRVFGIRDWEAISFRTEGVEERGWGLSDVFVV